MKLNSKYLIYTYLFLMIFCTLSFSETIDTIKINDLINNDKDFDAKKVIVEGEAIGHLMKRGNFVWFNINDKTNAIGIWANSELVTKIKYLGRHAVTGDRVKVEGIFQSKCPMHGGDTDIHADSIVVVKNGNLNQLSHEPKKVNVLVFLTGLLVCLYIIKILKKPH